MAPERLKFIGYGAVALLVLNLLLAALRVISWTVFWVVIILGALFAWKVVPGLRQNYKNCGREG